MKPEILSPAGNIESFYAAIEAGCDAVYIGGKSFGARFFSSNFSNEEIIEAIKYAHLYGVKVYATVNTLVFDEEVPDFLNYVNFLHQNNVDAIIIQDLGMFDLVRKTYPNLELHASTQMHIHTLDGVKLMERLGIKRVVLSREVNLEQIKQIKKNTSVQLEVFVHGALCVSYSGQCLMSYFLGGRSGNRGKCAGCCRQKYDLIHNNQKIDSGYLLSMKDLNTLENIGTLIDIGIDSFKIEGRMKSPEYVYLVTSIYRKAVDNYLKYKDTKITEEDILNLKKVYSREFTNGYILGSTNIINKYRPNHLGVVIGKVIKRERNKIFVKLTDNLSIGDGIRFLGKEDTGLTVTKFCINGDIAIINSDVFCEIGGVVLKTTDKNLLDEIKKKIKLKSRKVNITGVINVCVGKPLSLTINDGINIVTSNGDTVEKALKPLSNETIKKQIERTNDTAYRFTNLEIINDNNSFVPISKLNEIRRKALELLNEKRMYQIQYKKEVYDIDVPDFQREEKISLSIKGESIPNIKYDTLYLEEDLYNKIDSDKKVLKLPRVINKHINYNMPVLVSELGGVKRGVFTNFSLNVTNSYAASFLHSLGVQRITLSLELDDKKIEKLINDYHQRYKKRPNLELIIYGREEVMITKMKLKNNSYLKRKNDLFPIRETNNLTTIFNSTVRDFKDKDKYYKMGINHLRYDYLDESK